MLEYKNTGPSQGVSPCISTKEAEENSKMWAKHTSVYFSQEGIPVSTVRAKKDASPSSGRDDFLRTDSKK